MNQKETLVKSEKQRKTENNKTAKRKKEIKQIIIKGIKVMPQTNRQKDTQKKMTNKTKKMLRMGHFSKSSQTDSFVLQVTKVGWLSF